MIDLNKATSPTGEKGKASKWKSWEIGSTG